MPTSTAPQAFRTGRSRAWRDRAKCLGADLYEFFPDNTRSTKITQRRADEVIARYCGVCPVRGACIDEVLDVAENRAAETVGIRGGYLLRGTRESIVEIRAVRAAELAAQTPSCACRDTRCATCGPRAAAERANNRAATGTGRAHGPDLNTAPYRASDRHGLRAVHAPTLSIRDAVAMSVPEHRRRHHTDVATARAALAAVGAKWADARAWALEQGGWTRADVKAFNPLAVAAYLAAREAVSA